MTLSPRVAWAPFFCTALLSAATIAAGFYQGTQTAASATALALAVAAAATATLSDRRNRLLLSRADVSVVALSVALGVSIWSSRVPHLSANAAIWLALFFCAYAAARKLAARGYGRVLVAGIGTTGIAAGVVALALADRFAAGPFLYRHMFSALVLLCAFLLAGSVLAGERSPRGTWAFLGIALSACVAMMVVGLNGSRGVMLAGAAALFVVGVASGRRAPLGPLWFAAGGAVGLVVSNLLSRGFVAEQALSLATPGQTGLPRFVLWASAWPLIADRPLFGHGPDLTFAVWQPFRDPQDLSAGFYIHNSFLDFTVASGLVASIPLIFIFRETLYGACRRIRDASPVIGNKALAIWLLGATVMLLVHALADFNLLVPAIWLIFGMVAGLVAADSASVPARFQSSLSSLVAVGGLLLGVALPAYAVAHLAYERTHAQAVQSLEAGQVEKAYALADALTRSLIPADDGWLLRAHIVASAVLDADSASHNPAAPAAYRSAIGDIRTALSYNPLRPATYRTGGRLHLSAARLGFDLAGVALARELLAEGMRVDPRDLETRLLLAHTLQRADRPSEALDVLTAGLKYRQIRDARYATYRAQTRALAASLGRRQILAWLDELP